MTERTESPHTMTEFKTAPAVSSVPSTRIARAFSIQLICRALGMLASVVSVAMTARYLGPGRYGQLTIAIVFISLWVSLADLGVGTVIVRRVTSGRGDLERLVRVNSGLALVYCVPLAALVPRLPSPTRQPAGHVRRCCGFTSMTRTSES